MVTHMVNTTCQALISQVCWAFSYGFAQLLLSLLFAILTLWLVYGARLLRAATWVLASGCFTIGLLFAIGFGLMSFKVRWMPPYFESIQVYSPLVAAVAYALLLTACQLLFRYTVARGGIMYTRYLAAALFISNVLAAVVRACAIGSL